MADFKMSMCQPFYIWNSASFCTIFMRACIFRQSGQDLRHEIA